MWIVALVIVWSAGCGSATSPSVVRMTARISDDAKQLSHAPSRDLLHCALTPRVYELGEAGDGEPTAPIALGDAIAVAFTRTTAGTSELLVQRVLADGTLAPAVAIREGVHYARPMLVAAGARAFVLAVRPDGAAEAVPLDPTTGGASDADAAVALDVVPEDASIGPRGLVVTHSIGTGDHRRLVRRALGPAGTAHDARFPAPREWPTVREQLLASGADLDAVLVRAPGGVSIATIDAAGRETRSARLFPNGRSGTWSEASIAAGAHGLAVVRTGPEIADLSLYLAATAVDLARPITPIAIPLPAAVDASALVRRYPRVAALGDGWAISYWDGTGPSLVRVDAAGAITAEAIAVRSGDERGGHTDAQMTATADALAITWQVGPPMMSHGFPEEVPRRAGPRLAVLRCT
jgi:hypothetical protein